MKNIKFYTKEETNQLLNKKERLIFVDNGNTEFIAKYKDVADIIVDLNSDGEFNSLKIYDLSQETLEPIITTCGMYLDKCDEVVRKDIIENLVDLQLGLKDISDYKFIDSNVFEEIIEDKIFEREVD